MSADRRLISKANPPDQIADVYEADDVQSLFVDGINRINFQSAVSRLELYRLDLTQVQTGQSNPETGGQPEQRIIVYNVVLPTKALVEIINASVRILKSSQASILTAFESDVKRIGTMLDNIDVK
jgi:hypothetical protein